MKEVDFAEVVADSEALPHATSGSEGVVAVSATADLHGAALTEARLAADRFADVVASIAGRPEVILAAVEVAAGVSAVHIAAIRSASTHTGRAVLVPTHPVITLPHHQPHIGPESELRRLPCAHATTTTARWRAHLHHHTFASAVAAL